MDKFERRRLIEKYVKFELGYMSYKEFCEENEISYHSFIAFKNGNTNSAFIKQSLMELGLPLDDVEETEKLEKRMDKVKTIEEIANREKKKIKEKEEE